MHTLSFVATPSVDSMGNSEQVDLVYWPYTDYILTMYWPSLPTTYRPCTTVFTDHILTTYQQINLFTITNYMSWGPCSSELVCTLYLASFTRRIISHTPPTHQSCGIFYCPAKRAQHRRCMPFKNYSADDINSVTVSLKCVQLLPTWQWLQSASSP